MKQKPGLTLEQHKELSNELFMLKDKFNEISQKIQDSYPKNKRKGIRHLVTIFHNIEYLRGTLESLLYYDSEKWSREDRKGIGRIYYPGTNAKAGNEQEHSPCNHEK